MTRRTALSAALLALAALLVPAGSRGQNLEVSPVLVDLSSARPSAIVTVKNLGAGPMRYQVKAFRWTEDRTGKPTLTPSEDFSIFPPLFQLPPGDTRKVRVGATVRSQGTELAWRVVVEELPDAVARQGTSVTFRTRFAIPAFLAPAKPEVRCDVALAGEAGRLELVVVNRGTVRVKPTRTSVELYGEGGQRLKELEIAPWYVLAGGERAWDVKVPEELCRQVRRAKLVAEVGERRLEASRDLPEGACAK